MSAPTLAFSDFVDLVLVRLYELDKIDTSSFVDLTTVYDEINGDVPKSWLIDAAKVLQARSLAQVMINSKGVYAHISGEGRLYIERGEGKQKAEEVETNRSNYFHISVSGNNNQIIGGQQTGSATLTMSNAQGRSPWSDEVDAIEERLHKDTALSAEERDQALSYVRVIRGELRKREPNRTILAAVLEPLSQIISIVGQVAALIRAFGG